MSPKRGEGGKFASSVTNDDVLQALREHPDPVATARELADRFTVSPETIRRHLSELHEQDRVIRKEVGARAVVWWVTERLEASDAPAAPLRDLVGMLDPGEAEAARERSQTWREEFDEDLAADQT